MLLTEKIGNALIVGSSVIVTGPGGADDLLEIVSAKLDKAGMRVLAIKPPLDAASFMSQFARGWRLLLKGNDRNAVNSMLPKSSGERFTMFVHGAHTMPQETVGQVERMAEAWPGLRVVFGGKPDTAERLSLQDYPTLRNRISVSLQVSASDEDGEGKPPHQSVTGAKQGAKQKSFAPKRKRLDAVRSSQTLRLYGGAAAILATTATVAVVLNTYGLEGTAARWNDTVRSVTRLASHISLPGVATPSPAQPVEIQTASKAPGVLDPTTTPLSVAAETTGGPVDGPNPAIQEVPSSTAAAVASTNPQAIADIDKPEDVQFVAEPVRTTPPTDLASAATPEPARPAAVAEPAPAPVIAPTMAAPVTPGITPELAQSMGRRGRAILDLGDVSGARLLLERAAAAGNGDAALALSSSFDAATLRRIRAVGIKADPVQAATWLRVAKSLGAEPTPPAPVRVKAKS